ncbi:uncharacterized protein KRP23_5155 [Phytophthora ramorum]|uniref:uncharacterized protein n=1 Tax=Phytophthora ramorum TaxID=164328 RepID=UPI00309CFEBF|nr:hypothetical protein KRP23_5155 [Phytophthora ramorum]
MQKRTRQVTKECTSLTSRPSLTHHDVNLLDVNGDMEDFRVLFRHLENAYQAVDTLFTANGLAAMSLPPGDVHMRENVDGRYLECCSHKLLPFAMRMAAEATWEHFKGVEKHFGNGSLYEKTAKDLDDPYTIIENFTKELYSDTRAAQLTNECASLGVEKHLINGSLYEKSEKDLDEPYTIIADFKKEPDAETSDAVDERVLVADDLGVLETPRR